MTGHIINFASRRKITAPDPDTLICGALSDYLSAILDALQRGDEGLAMIHLEGLSPATRLLVNRFSEHLDEMQTLTEQITITRNMARLRAAIGERSKR